MDVYGLVGNPVGHSVSPPMHEAAYEALDLDARYVTFETDPGKLAVAIEGAAALGISGVNVTIPFKEDVMDLVETDPTAARIGAVNTIDLQGPQPKGYNTDAEGAKRAFEHHDVDLAGRNVVVVGAGGAARAICFMLSEAESEIHVVNRTPERARELAEAVGGAGHSLDALDELVPGADVLVNATSVGMDEDRSPVRSGLLHEDLVVMDIVYSPLGTRLLREAEGVGATTIDGAWMLLFQGVAAFEIWTGRSAPVEAMNAALRSALSDG